MEKNKIGLDIDGVVLNFISSFLDYFNLKNKTNYSLESLTNYNLWECGLSNSKEEVIRIIDEFQNSEYFDKIDFVEGAKDSINLISNFYEVYFITSRPESIKEKTEKFFYNHFPNHKHNFIFSGEIYGGKKKSEICKNLGIKIMVEDNVEYSLDCATKGIKVFLMNNPWNKNYENHKNIIRVNGWKEIFNKLMVEKR